MRRTKFNIKRTKFNIKRTKLYCKCGCHKIVLKIGASYTKGHAKRKNYNPIPPLCACGCGQSVKWAYWASSWNKYINNHRQLKGGWEHTEETKIKIRSTNKISQNTEESIQKKLNAWKNTERRLSASKRMKIRCKNPIFYSQLKNRMLERWKDADYILKQKSKKQTDKWKENNGKLVKARWTDDYKQKYINEFLIGDKNPNWKGGLSFLPYSPKFTKALKREIKERDHHQCQNPNCPKTHILLSVHHIDYDKQNCEPYNLITLCMPCNQRANGNRSYWKILYTAINDKRNSYSKFSIS